MRYLYDGVEGTVQVGEGQTMAPYVPDPLAASSRHPLTVASSLPQGASAHLLARCERGRGPSRRHRRHGGPVSRFATRCRLSAATDLSSDPTLRFEESFLKSFMGYLNSCHVAKAQPNPLQMLVFLDSVSPSRDGPLCAENCMN